MADSDIFLEDRYYMKAIHKKGIEYRMVPYLKDTIWLFFN
jgi:hypothetical protein